MCIWIYSSLNRELTRFWKHILRHQLDFFDFQIQRTRSLLRSGKSSVHNIRELAQRVHFQLIAEVFVARLTHFAHKAFSVYPHALDSHLLCRTMIMKQALRHVTQLAFLEPKVAFDVF